MLRQVQTEYGTLRGEICGDPRVTAFKGVPYAKPPVGELRFRAPQPPEPWEGIRDATRFGPISIHKQPGLDFSEFYTKELNPTASEYEMSEDCLYLNIWTPARSAADKLPVFFYIHGGGLLSGYSYEVEFDGERVAKNGVIYITVGYRLGALGFFAHPDLTAEAPDEPIGSNGLLDQLAALRWVRENIEAFGGDPDQIVIAGQSAGGMSVAAHLASPMARGLFQGAIMMSASGVPRPGEGYWRTVDEAYADGQLLLDYLGVKTVEEARMLPAEVIAQTGLGRFPGRKLMFWTPVVDGKYLVEHEREAILSGHIHNVPIMLGGTRGESVPRETMPIGSFREFAHRRYGDKADELLSLCDFTSQEAFDAQYSREILFGEFYQGCIAYVKALSRLGRPVYSYVFDHDIPGEDHPGSYHGSDMWFVFDSLGHCWRPFEGRHYDLARQVSAYWANFVKTGDPNGCDRYGETLPRWEPFTEGDPFTISFTDKPERWKDDDPALREFVQKLLLD